MTSSRIETECVQLAEDMTGELEELKKIEAPGDRAEVKHFKCRVRVDGLHSAAQYNGTLGTVQEYDATKKRWIVLMDVDNVKINGNTISSTNSNGGITISPNGSGSIVLNAGTISAEDGILGISTALVQNTLFMSKWIV